MPTNFVTPSAKQQERVCGRWVQSIQIKTRKEKIIHYGKTIFGTPIPFILSSLVILCFLSQPAFEIATWAGAFFTTIYIAFDRFGQNREFNFFRLGPDLFLFGVLITGFINAINNYSFTTMAPSLMDLSWVPLIYILTYSFELFPGLNRLYYLFVISGTAIASYCIWQHFSGLDPIFHQTLPIVPIKGLLYFKWNGVLNDTQVLGTLFAMLLPFPLAGFLLSEKRNHPVSKTILVIISLTLLLATIWTYQFSIWTSTLAGFFISFFFKGNKRLWLILITLTFLLITSFVFYGGPSQALSSLNEIESTRVEAQRTQINMLVHAWKNEANASWVGLGPRVREIVGFDPSVGNTYFFLLAEWGAIGATFYLFFILSSLLLTYRTLHEVPSTHYWHRVILAGGLASQVAFHVAGLYWLTMNGRHLILLLALILSSIFYLSEHYGRGLVPDDQSL